MKTILGLDLGTNSIGWALIDTEQKEILGMGSRIIPMDAGDMGKFAEGGSFSKTAERTKFRGIRRLRERNLLRRERLHRVLNVLGFLPEHYSKEIDFERHFGQFLDEKEPKIAWKKNEETGKFEFLFQKSFLEMAEDFKANGQNIKIPYDWTIYYLRKRALTHKIDKEELAWLLLNFNQKRGYYQLRGEDDEKTDVKEYCQLLKIISVEKGEQDKKNIQKTWYKMTFENGWEYSATFTSEPNWLNTEKEFLITEELDENGNIKIVKDKKSDTTGKEKRRITPLPSFDEINLMPKEQQDKIHKKIKARTEITITNSGKTVGQYIYETLLQNPTQKIRGKLVRTIERKYYKDELIAILKKQIELQPELFTEQLYSDCVRELYRSNTTQQTILNSKDFLHLFVNDIIFYQRPLRSQKSSIGNCTLEFRKHKDKDGNEVMEYLKAVPKSNPYYQEFRLWQWLYNLKIYTKEEDKDVTAEFIASDEDKVNLFDFLNSRKEIEQKPLIQYLLKQKEIKGKNEAEKYRWNYVEDKKYPCNETKTMISTRLAKVENVPADFLTFETEYQLWHIIYSVTDKHEFEKALKTFAIKYKLDVDSFVENFKKFPPFKSDYGSFSEKAIKKLLPLMRLGNYWNFDAIDEKSKNRISKIITGEYDETIKNRVLEKAINLTSENDYQDLPLWLAQYIVYDRHSEASSLEKWNSATDLEKYLQDFKQHSLRNPIVEQVVTETLRVVRDIWLKYGQGAKDFFKEIHVELGREMKNTAEDRKKITNQVTENENTNLRIKALIMELKENSDGKLQVDDVRPYSPIQQEALKIYEEYAISNIEENDTEKEFVQKISKTAQPSKAELQRYKLWLEQRYRSPYTGAMIPLGKLFTEEYQIEHIIPKSRYFDDSLSNKVICEAAVNQKKDKQLGLEFIKNHKGEKIECGMGKSVQIFTEEQYRDFVKQHYSKNNKKRNNLLLEEIPDKMIERQMNDTRYISKFISNLLSNLVRIDEDGARKIIKDAEILANNEPNEKKAEKIREKAKSEATDDGVNSKNILPGNGKITTTLKQDWGLNDIWNDLILPRFERMNELTQTSVFTAWNEQYQKYLPTVPLELSKGFQKKRIDHRHHAMDALVIACATRDHINLLNNQHAKSETSRYDLQHKLRNTEKWTDKDGKERDKFTAFKKPWDNFTVDARKELEKIVVSFKQNLRVINKATNKYEKIKDGKKVGEKQEGINWAIRKPLHKETVFAKVSLRKTKTVSLKEALKDWKMLVDKVLKEEIKNVISQYGGNASAETLNKYFKGKNYKLQDVDISKVEVYYFDDNISAVRKPIDTSFTEKVIKESVTDTGIQKILLNHLSTKNNNPELAFSPEGIEEMNKNIVSLNDGKSHQPILKVRVYETIGNKFAVGIKGNKKDKYVEAAKGTNLFFAVYADENGKRSFETIPLKNVIDLMKSGENAVPEINEKRNKLQFYLSPNDLVYVPTEDEIANKTVDFRSIDGERIYKLTDVSGTTANFIQSSIAEVLFNMNADKQKKTFGKQLFAIQNEIGVGSQGSKNPKAITGEMIKDVCIKLNVDRLGNIKLVGDLQ